MSRLTHIQNFARAGYLARTVVYVLLGYFALSTARSEGTTGVLQQIKEAPFGIPLLILVGIGLLGYGIFRLYGALIDIQGDGDGVKGIGKRIGHSASGLAHLFLGYYAIKAALMGTGGGGGSASSEAAGTVMALPLGEVVILIVGIGFLLGALNQATKAVTAKFMNLLDPDAPGFAKPLGRIGYAARAVVFALLGWQIAKAGLGGNASQVGGIGDALDALRDNQTVYMIVAFGLLVFGLFSLVMARYRRIRDEDVVERAKALA